ncbi:hypothetical protein SNEBB_002566 [Seison nebaliae]|nr:hypothetical protein SNEBB_002566 [Seison nebaliae]
MNMLILSLLFLLSICSVFAQEYSEEFDLKPTEYQKPHNHRISYEGVSCEFVYEARGGTNEKWRLTINKEHSDIYNCVVDREGSSYMMFENFHIYLHNGRALSIKLLDSSKKEVPAKSYDVEKERRHIQSTSEFGHSIGSISVQIERSEVAPRDL